MKFLYQLLNGIIIVLIILLIILFALLLNRYLKKRKIKKQIHLLANNEISMTPEEFFKMRNKSFGKQGRPHYALQYNYEGVYILYNSTKKMYYVGQAHKVLDRVNAHFTGKGNGDVYADYKYGDQFIIRTIELSKSGFKTLNELERQAIMTYNAYAKGYNKTRGNR